MLQRHHLSQLLQAASHECFCDNDHITTAAIKTVTKKASTGIRMSGNLYVTAYLTLFQIDVTFKTG